MPQISMKRLEARADLRGTHMTQTGPPVADVDKVSQGAGQTAQELQNSMRGVINRCMSKSPRKMPDSTWVRSGKAPERR